MTDEKSAIKSLKEIKAWSLAVSADKKLSATARLVLWRISLHVNVEDGLAFPGIDTLAAALGLSERTVQYAVAECVRRGCLVRVIRGGRHGDKNVSTRYSLALPNASQDAMGCVLGNGSQHAMERVPTRNGLHSQDAMGCTLTSKVNGGVLKTPLPNSQDCCLSPAREDAAEDSALANARAPSAAGSQTNSDTDNRGGLIPQARKLAERYAAAYLAGDDAAARNYWVHQAACEARLLAKDNRLSDDETNALIAGVARHVEGAPHAIVPPNEIQPCANGRPSKMPRETLDEFADRMEAPLPPPHETRPDDLPVEMWALVEALADDVKRRYDAAGCEDERLEIICDPEIDDCIEHVADDYDLTDDRRRLSHEVYCAAIRARFLAAAA